MDSLLPCFPVSLLPCLPVNLPVCLPENTILSFTAIIVLITSPKFVFYQQLKIHQPSLTDHLLIHPRYRYHYDYLCNAPLRFHQLLFQAIHLVGILGGGG